MRVLIVDDEDWARRRIVDLLRGEPDLEVAAECAGGEDAVRAIAEMQPDLVFLDVQMPDLDGFEVLRALPPESLPLVIFATAHDRYAVRAFDANALDYLLKPFDEQRFRISLQRAREEMDQPRAHIQDKLAALLDQLPGSPRYLRRMVVKRGGCVVFLKTAEVEWIQASGNYIEVHTAREAYLLRETMARIEPRLDPEQFLRIHRSTIVNLDSVKQLEPWDQGELVMTLKNGKQFTVGRTYCDRLRRVLENTVD